MIYTQLPTRILDSEVPRGLLKQKPKLYGGHPLCDIIKVYIFTSDTTIINNSKYYKFLVRGYMFRLLMQQSSGQL